MAHSETNVALDLIFEAKNQTCQFIRSQACARLIGVTPEYLCAMHSRNEGPPWSCAGIRALQDSFIPELGGSRLPAVEELSLDCGSSMVRLADILERRLP